MIESTSCHAGCSGHRVVCDHCDRPASEKCGNDDPAQAAMTARKNGFITVPGARASSPMMWLCKDCSKS